MTALRLGASSALFFVFFVAVASFQIPTSTRLPIVSPQRSSQSRFFEEKKDGVLELADEEEVIPKPNEDKKPVAPFLSQGEISEEATNVDLSDPKQARVMFYIILSLLPVLFLIPLMLGSREMIPAEMLPPVELN